MSSYIALSSQTLGSATSSITFSSIPTTANGKTLRDLIVIAQTTADPNFERILLTFNGDTGANYSDVSGFAQDTTVSSTTGNGNTSIRLLNGGDVSGSTRTTLILQIHDFAQTNKHKSVLYRMNRTTHFVGMGAGRWANTGAVSSLTLQAFSSRNFETGSTFSLYGIEG
jgi:hypothetical protein